MKTVIIAICTVFCFNPVSLANPQAMVKPATDGRVAAVKWLKLVDGGQYATSWTQAARSFRSRVTKAKWIAGMKKMREHYGKVLSREFKESLFAVNPPGFPAGEHETLRFEVNLARRGRAAEVVTMMMQKNGEWLVSGYYIEPLETLRTL